MHSVSDDMEQWKKLPEDTFFAPADMYEPHDWRDPFVFWNEETKEYNMLVAARFKKGILRRRCLTVLCASKDLTKWEVKGPFYAPGIPEVIMPKKGKLNKEEKQRERAKEFKKLRYAHSSIESNINMLEHHGLNRCVDKVLHGYKRYTGLSVLAYNLHILGNCLIEQEKQKENKRLKKLAMLYKKAA